MTIETKEFKTPWRRNRGLWSDSKLQTNPGSIELSGTPKIIAEIIKERLETDRTVLVLELGGGWAGDTVAIAANFRSEVQSGRLRVFVTNVEQFDLEHGITSPVEDRRTRKFPPDTETELPSPELLEMIRQNAGNVTYISGVDTYGLTELMEKLGERADVIIEHWGGVYHHPNIKMAAGIVAHNLKDDGVFITTDGLLDKISDRDLKWIGLVRDKEPMVKDPPYLIYHKRK